jgi:hypothetical protein
MTVPEMHIAVRLGLDKTSSFEYASFQQEELDFWLNESQERFIKQRLFGNNYKQEKYDQTQKRIDDIKSLVVFGYNIDLAGTTFGVNIKDGALPLTSSTAPYMFYLNSNVRDISGNELQTGDVVSIDIISKYIKDSVNNPYLLRPLVFFYKNAGYSGERIAFIYSDEFVPNTFDITYIKRPKKLIYSSPGTYETTTCELSEHTHKEIVSICVNLLLENIESPRIQSFPQINSSTVE